LATDANLNRVALKSGIVSCVRFHSERMIHLKPTGLNSVTKTFQ